MSYDFDDQNTCDIFAIGKKVKIDLKDMDYISWLNDLTNDANILSGFTHGTAWMTRLCFFNRRCSKDTNVVCCMI